MKTMTIEGQIRNDLGKKASKSLRRDENVPCVLYGEGQNIHFSAPLTAFRHVVYTPDFLKIDLNLDGAHYEAIIKDIQYHPVKDDITHVDFQRLSDGKILTTQLPVKLVGSSPGVREGGKMKVRVRKLNVKVAPKHLVEYIPVDISELQLGRSVRIGDLKVEGVQIMNSPGIPVATCEIPRALRGKTAAAEAVPAKGAAKAAPAKAAPAKAAPAK
ncbi:MAG: 50S ribosomal protein L25/general stress protein Ctc [Bacteroidetes bacterium]|nr:50S ribosomal protein L25/general stress protein Ctc [Bacteroidota bacterium]